MWAYMGLIDGAQAVLAWTFNTHLGGEEQALFGLLDHDGTPSWKLAEFASIASEFNKLQTLGFPRHPEPQVAIAYSYESRLASNPNGPSNTTRQYVTTPYMDQELGAFSAIFEDNIDSAVVNIGHEDLSKYKLVVVPGDYLMDSSSADALRRYVESGGTVVMTAYSAKVDESGQWFDTPLPGRVSDVFGLKTNEFYVHDQPLHLAFGKKRLTGTSRYYEVLVPTTAQVIASLSNVPGTPPAITANRFGNGLAIYLATPAQESLMKPLLRSLYPRLGLRLGPATPPGVYGRVVDGRRLYVNTTNQTKTIGIDGNATGIITGKTWHGAVRLGPYQVDLLEVSPHA